MIPFVNGLGNEVAMGSFNVIDGLSKIRIVSKPIMVLIALFFVVWRLSRNNRLYHKIIAKIGRKCNRINIKGGLISQKSVKNGYNKH